MNKVIFKYQIQPTTPILLHLPKNAEILFVETQQETMCIWCLVNKNARLEPRWFHLYGIGEPIQQDTLTIKETYIGTFKLKNDTLILHLFESVPI
jgi:hypothetical protein